MSSSSNPLRLATMPLYGILVTQKSMLLGRRRLAKAHYAKFIANRVVESRLPPELVDQIAEDLIELDNAEMSRIWRTLTSHKCHRAMRFDLPAVNCTEAEKAAVDELTSLSGDVLVGKILVKTSDGTSVWYAHISASKNRPSLAQLYPGAVPSTGPALQYEDGHLQVHCHTGTSTMLSREHATVKPSSKKRQVSRLVQVDGIEDAIKNWDQEAVERYVKVLKLKVMSMNGEEEGQNLTPRLRLLQSVEWT
jgi:hypothetical protein